MSQHPGVEGELHVLRGKWVIPILVALSDGMSRPVELSNTITDISDKALHETLRRLLGHGLVTKQRVGDAPPATEYHLTETGCVALHTARNLANLDQPAGPPYGAGVNGITNSPGPATPSNIDPTAPNVARMYDYYLGGKNNFAADRDAADKVISVAPFAAPQAVESRLFLMRAIHYLVDQGIDQFVDIGSGLPTQQNVHEVAQRLSPHARVVYVDNDPVVLAHSRALLDDTPQTAIINGDLRDPDAILDNPDLRAIIDLSRPVALLMVLVLHCLADEDDPWNVVARLRHRLLAGSHLVISHICRGDHLDQGDAGARIYHDTSASAPMVFRELPVVRALFTGLDLVEPGLTWVHEWRPELAAPKLSTPWPSHDDPPHVVLGGVGRVSDSAE